MQMLSQDISPWFLNLQVSTSISLIFMVLSNTLTDYTYVLLWNKTPFDSKTNQDKKQERSPHRPIQPHTFRSEQKSKISSVTTWRSNNDSSIHTVLNQTPGHLQNYVLKFEKGVEFEKSSGKNKTKTKTFLPAGFPHLKT